MDLGSTLLVLIVSLIQCRITGKRVLKKSIIKMILPGAMSC